MAAIGSDRRHRWSDRTDKRVKFVILVMGIAFSAPRV